MTQQEFDEALAALREGQLHRGNEGVVFMACCASIHDELACQLWREDPRFIDEEERPDLPDWRGPSHQQLVAYIDSLDTRKRTGLKALAEHIAPKVVYPQHMVYPPH